MRRTPEVILAAVVTCSAAQPAATQSPAPPQALDIPRIEEITGINIVAIHHHMSGETPRILFLHYWGRGPAAALARTLKAALETQRK